MSLCLYVSAHIFQKPCVQTSRNFLYILIVAVARSSSDDNVICYVLPVLWTTTWLPIIGQANATPVGRLLSDSSAGEALEAKSDIYDCLVFIWSTSFNRQKLQWFYLDGCEEQQ